MLPQKKVIFYILLFIFALMVTVTYVFLPNIFTHPSLFSKEVCKINRITSIINPEKLRYIKIKKGFQYSILIYTPFFGYLQWPYFSLSKCNFNTSLFQITYNKADFCQSDLVIFHSRDMPSISELKYLDSVKRKTQLWIYFTAESILNNPPVADINKFFQITATYGVGSDIYMPYRFHSKIVSRKSNAIKKNYFVNKTKEVAWFVSNCGGNARNKLANKLISYGVKIEVSGKCSQLFQNNDDSKYVPKPKSSHFDLKKFKFYFSAENSLCDGYITEKYWQTPFNNNMIPIVLGGSNYSNPMIAIPGSFIDAMSFDSPKALAEHILDVGSNATKYNSYFEWKNSWKLDTDNYYCSLCRSLLKGFKLRKDALATTMDIQKCSKPTTVFNTWINK